MKDTRFTGPSTIAILKDYIENTNKYFNLIKLLTIL